jgi:hypothetical protein
MASGPGPGAVSGRWTCKFVSNEWNRCECVHPCHTALRRPITEIRTDYQGIPYLCLEIVLFWSCDQSATSQADFHTTCLHSTPPPVAGWHAAFLFAGLSILGAPDSGLTLSGGGPRCPARKCTNCLVDLKARIRPCVYSLSVADQCCGCSSIAAKSLAIHPARQIQVGRLPGLTLSGGGRLASTLAQEPDRDCVGRTNCARPLDH